ncbi:hypothetical protein MRX96_038278 [Rhipicephalus microplus]
MAVREQESAFQRLLASGDQRVRDDFVRNAAFLARSDHYAGLRLWWKESRECSIVVHGFLRAVKHIAIALRKANCTLGFFVPYAAAHEQPKRYAVLGNVSEWPPPSRVMGDENSMRTPSGHSNLPPVSSDYGRIRHAGKRFTVMRPEQSPEGHGQVRVHERLPRLSKLCLSWNPSPWKVSRRRYCSYACGFGEDGKKGVVFQTPQQASRYRQEASGPHRVYVLRLSPFECIRGATHPDSIPIWRLASHFKTIARIVWRTSAIPVEISCPTYVIDRVRTRITGAQFRFPAMAGNAAALTAALLALLGELYKRGVRIWLDHGLSHLFRYLLSVAQLTYLLRRKDRRFRYLEPAHNDDVINCGAICTPLEWSLECAREKGELKKDQDKVLFNGVNTGGDRLVVSVSRLQNPPGQNCGLSFTQLMERSTSLPVSLTLDRSAGSCFSAAGLRLQCLAPNRRWRVAFNGLLSLASPELEVPVKFGFIWSTVSHTLEMPYELAPTHLAESLAKMSTFSMLQDAPQALAEEYQFFVDFTKLVSEMDTYDQAGMMCGELTVEGNTRELCLWGYKIRSRGNAPQASYEEHHQLGFLENGDMYHYVCSTNYGGENGVSYGSFYAPASMMRIDRVQPCRDGRSLAHRAQQAEYKKR